MEEVDEQDPVQQHIEIHRRRIKIILGRLLEKLSLAVCIETLLQDHLHFLEQHLTLKQLWFLKDSINLKYQKNYSISSKYTYCKNLEDANGSSSLCRRTLKTEQEFTKDMYLSNILSTLHHSENVMNKVKEIYNEKYGIAIVFIEEMVELKDFIIEMLNTTATQVRMHDKRIGQAWINNEKYKNKIIEMEKNSENKRNEQMCKVNEKNAIIKNYKEQMDISRESCLNDLMIIINNSEHRMARKTTQSEENREYLAEEAKQVIQQYQTLLENNLAREKQMRIKRYKVETVLAGWLAKYDEGIGELQAVMEVELDGFNDEKEAFDDLTARTEKQLEEYTFLMNEKAENERIEHEYKVYLFTANYCARKIQRWFRHYLALWEKRRKRAKAARKKQQ